VIQSSDVVTVERFIPAPAAAIFALIADPNRHREIDGSGSVRDQLGQASQLRLGSKFGMSMRMRVPYSMVSTVIEFEQDRRLAWQTFGPTPIGRLVAGRIWRYELTPLEGGTLVRETWDISHESPLTKPLVKGAAEVTGRNMARTLARIEEIVTA
jgi:hypothetical protein